MDVAFRETGSGAAEHDLDGPVVELTIHIDERDDRAISVRSKMAVSGSKLILAKRNQIARRRLDALSESLH